MTFEYYGFVQCWLEDCLESTKAMRFSCVTTHFRFEAIVDRVFYVQVASHMLFKQKKDGEAFTLYPHNHDTITILVSGLVVVLRLTLETP